MTYIVIYIISTVTHLVIAAPNIVTLTVVPNIVVFNKIISIKVVIVPKYPVLVVVVVVVVVVVTVILAITALSYCKYPVAVTVIVKVIITYLENQLFVTLINPP